MIISKVIDISCNGRRNVLLNTYIINKFVDTINGFVCITRGDLKVLIVALYLCQETVLRGILCTIQKI